MLFIKLRSGKIIQDHVRSHSAAIDRLEQDIVVLKSQQDNRPAAPQGGGNTAEFDAFRGQMTRNINTLQAQIQNLQQQLNARP